MESLSLKEKLIKKSKNFSHEVYYITKELPQHEIFGIISQLRRAVISVSCNIVEGFARDNWGKSKKELLRFIEFSYGSLAEVKFLLEFCNKQYKLSKDKMIHAQKNADNLGVLLFGFIKSLRKDIRRL